jgi:hypothetical protein
MLRHRQGYFVLDKAFPLIDGGPSVAHGPVGGKLFCLQQKCKKQGGGYPGCTTVQTGDIADRTKNLPRIYADGREPKIEKTKLHRQECLCHTGVGEPCARKGQKSLWRAVLTSAAHLYWLVSRAAEWRFIFISRRNFNL